MDWIRGSYRPGLPLARDRVLSRERQQDQWCTDQGAAMTLICYDSIYAKNLPAGADAYLGYVDGYWPDYQDEVQKFSSAYIIGLTVFDSQQGEGCDIEKGDLTVQQGAQWIHDAQGRVTRPIAYASVSNMAQLVSELDALNVSRS